jgi:hypothetical protein
MEIIELILGTSIYGAGCLPDDLLNK